jgi:hypothetical protein
MKIVKESINFERGLSDREIKSKLVGFRKGQILASKIKEEDMEEGTMNYIWLYRLWIYIGKSEDPYYRNAKYDIESYPFGFISESGNLRHMNRMKDASYLMTRDLSLRVLKDREAEIVKTYIEDPKNQGLIKDMEEYHNLKIFL